MCADREHSARTIVEVMRHETAIGQLRGDWKLNDWYTPSLARLFSALHQEHAGLFEFRRMKVAA